MGRDVGRAFFAVAGHHRGHSRPADAPDALGDQGDFVSLDPAQLTLPRKADGSLPDIDFLKLKRNSKLYDAGTGFQFSAQNL